MPTYRRTTLISIQGQPTQKQSAFGEAYVEGGNASEAYRQTYSAGNMSANAIMVEASRALANPKVSLRVLELQAEARERCQVSVQSITIELEAARTKAQGQGNASAMVSASMGKAKLHGLLTDTKERDVVIVNITGRAADL